MTARAEVDGDRRRAICADMNAIIRDEGGLICPMFNDWVDATTDRVAGYVEGTKGFGLMNNYAPLRMWVVS